MKTVLFIPGYQENLESRDYAATLEAIKSAGYNVTFVPIQWKRTTIVDWVAEFNETFLKYDPMSVIIAGFSFGAMTSLVAAANLNPAGLWLFSLSPYFLEDDIRPEWGKGLGSRRMKEFNKLKFTDLSKKIHCPTLIFVGEAEAKKYPELGIRFENANKQISGSKGIIVPETVHDVTDAKYLKAIKKLI